MLSLLGTVIAHNLSIRWMDRQGRVAEGGTENVGDVGSSDGGGIRMVRQNSAESVLAAGSSCFTKLLPNIEGKRMCSIDFGYLLVCGPASMLHKGQFNTVT